MDYFTYNRRRGNSVNQDRLNAPLPPAPAPGTPGAGTPGPRPPAMTGTLESLRAPSSIRIRRLPSGLSTPRPPSQQSPQPPVAVDAPTTGRRRSSSEPQRYGAGLEPPAMNLARQRTAEDPHSRMTPLAEETPGAGLGAPSDSSQYYEASETPPVDDMDGLGHAERIVTGASAMNEAGNAARQNRGLTRVRTAASAMDRQGQPASDEYHSDVVDLLDLVGKGLRLAAATPKLLY